VFATNLSSATMFYLLNYKIWGKLPERVYKTKIEDVLVLRERIVDEWDKLDQRIIDKVVGEHVAKEILSLCGCKKRRVLVLTQLNLSRTLLKEFATCSLLEPVLF